MLQLFKKRKTPQSPTRVERARDIYADALKQKRCYTNVSYIVRRYVETMGQKPDLESPVLFTEKIQWMKLYYNNPLHVRCADKYAVRDYVESRGYAHILNNLIAVYTRAEDIVLEQLPEKFVIKATHGCTWNYLCTDKRLALAQWKEAKALLNEWLSQDYSIHGRELHYTYIPPRLICESFLENSDGTQLKDYKIHCFHGEPKLVQVDYERFADHQRNYYDPDWKLTDIKWAGHDNYPYLEEKPATLKEMLEVARALSSDFSYVRVDLYNVEGKVVFGELTFTPGAGFTKLEPQEIDAVMGSWLTLPTESEYAIK